MVKIQPAGTLEEPKIRKDTAVLTNDVYNTPKTSLMIFHFEPHQYQSSLERMKGCSVKHSSVEGKDIYIVDEFFSEGEEHELRDFSKNASFSISIYADQESKEKGEEPARAMNNKEKWMFFSNPPQSVKEVYKWLGTLAHLIDADITTLPWDICDQKICASAFATNRIEKMSSASMELGKHEDYNTEKGIPFGIPKLYSKNEELHPSSFVSGDKGKPFLVSLMLYSTDENFLPEYGMGTVFFTHKGLKAEHSSCLPMRMVLFEGDIIHGIEQSALPSGVNTWRVSYVFKLAINPRQEDQNVKSILHDVLG